jgi:hypothetical protein
MSAVLERSPKTIDPREVAPDEPFLDVADPLNPIFREKLEEMRAVNWEVVPEAGTDPTP